MDSILLKQDDAGRWHVAQAPHQVEITMSMLCGANTDVVHMEGRRLVWCNEVWYLPTGYDTGRGILHCLLDRDERPEWK